MRTGTIISLGASAVLGIGALIVARVWLPQPAAHPPTAAQPQAPSTQTVPMVVATGPIPYGTRLDASKLTVVQVPPGALPAGAFSSPAQLLSQNGGAPIVLTSLSAREPLLPTQLSGPGARAIVSATIDPGMRAYTIGITDVAGVGGHVLPGDYVDIIVTRTPPTPNAVKNLCGDCKFERADVVLQNIKVLGMDLNVDPTTTQSIVSHTATLEVSVEDAQRLAVASQIGSLSLALRRMGQADITPVRTVEVGDVRSTAPAAPGPRFPSDLDLGASRPERAPRRAPSMPSSPSGPPVVVHSGHSIVIVHGDSSTTVEVPAGGGA